MEVLIKNLQPEQVSLQRLTEIAKRSLQVEHFGRPAEVSIVLTDDEHIHELNRDYRDIDRPTDVLSFSQIEGEPVMAAEEPVMLGDVVVSVDTAKRQAVKAGHSLDDELALLVAHGMLHLLGYDDRTDEEAAVMREHERAILKQ